MSVSVVIPTYNEGGNATKMLRRLDESLRDVPNVEIIFVDDGTDHLPEAVAKTPTLIPVHVHRRKSNIGGLGGAVIEGIRRSKGDLIVVMDGDLQHPPEKVPELIAAARGTDVVVGSRYRAGGNAGGLDSGVRKAVSRGTGTLSKVTFPDRLKECTDPMSGFFVVRRSAVDVTALRPHGFKILLEILARAPHQLRIAEVPFAFGDRVAGESHASFKEGLRFLHQLLLLRFANRAFAFALVGLSGILPNLALLTLLTHSRVFHTHYVLAAIIATQVATLWNFVGAEKFVWKDKHGLRHHRFLKFWIIGEVDLVRLPFVILLVEGTGMGTVLASVLTMLALFVIRFTLADRIVYKPRRVTVPQRPHPTTQPAVEDAA